MSAGAATGACTHCGLPSAGGRDANGERFCCSGCFVAHGLGYNSEADADRLLARVVLSAFPAIAVTRQIMN